MSKMIKWNRILILLLVASVGLAVWQTYRVDEQQKTIKNQLANAAVHSAYYLHSLKLVIDSNNEKNAWEDKQSLESLKYWLAYTKQSVDDTNAAFQAFSGFVPNEANAINDIAGNLFGGYFMKIAPILAKPGKLSEYDKIQISEISRVLTSVPDLYPRKLNDLDGVSDSFVRLRDAWAAEPPYPNASDVESLQFHKWVLQPNNDPAPLYSKNAADKRIIEKIIGYLLTSKSEGYDDEVPSESAPSNIADIELKYGTGIRLHSAGNHRVFVTFSSNSQTICILSPELSNWLDSGWKKDLPEKQ